MFLISVKCEYDNNIKSKLESLYNRKVTIFTKDDIIDPNKYKAYEYVITEYNKDVIDHFLNENKILIVMDSSSYENKYKNENIYYCSSMNDIQEVINEKGIKKHYRIFKIAAFLIVLIIVSWFLASLLQNYNNNTTTKVVKNKTEKQQSKKVDVKAQNYLFLGDSITEYYNLDLYYDESIPVVNSGIAGNKAYDILTDMDNRVYRYNPTKVFLLVGTNDLFHRTDPEIVNNIADIVRQIHKHRKNTEVYVESIYPVNGNTEGNDIVIDWMVSTRDNERIREINRQIKENSEEFGYTYLDFYSMLADEDGVLKLEYTVDGLHISEEGYKIITKEIMKIIESDDNE